MGYCHLRNRHRYKKQLLAQGFAKNIRIGGDFSEVHFRNLLQQFVPEGFGVTSGHIVARTSQNIPPVVSPQCDVIIFDKMVPHSLLPFKQREVNFDFVPVEAVVGVFETKTTLYDGKSKNSLQTAASHLKNILQTIELNPKDTGQYLSGGMRIEPSNGIAFKGGKSSNPLIGILACKTTKKFLKKPNARNYLDAISKLMSPYRLDIVLSMNGGILCPCTANQFMVDPKRETEGVLMQQSSGIQNNLSRAQVVARGIGIILLYLQSTSGRHLTPQDYLFYEDTR